ncbi:unnamed protein product [Dimorphilus gyrociliatus]|uniref:Uncharacterized protein n=1 Tax=Dimorphilus gyrociliatus TaxID=2664684 RepID=A0A7I8VEE4_9ANNE|nr:unnamed protein product [Dimorphilus gyrociliatus]
MDFDVDPCDDFYQYACGNWENNMIAPEFVDFYTPKERLRLKAMTQVYDFINPFGNFNSEMINFNFMIYIRNFFDTCRDFSNKREKFRNFFHKSRIFLSYKLCINPVLFKYLHVEIDEPIDTYIKKMRFLYQFKTGHYFTKDLLNTVCPLADNKMIKELDNRLNVLLSLFSESHKIGIDAFFKIGPKLVSNASKEEFVLTINENLGLTLGKTEYYNDDKHFKRYSYMFKVILSRIWKADELWRADEYIKRMWKFEKNLVKFIYKMGNEQLPNHLKTIQNIQTNLSSTFDFYNFLQNVFQKDFDLNTKILFTNDGDFLIRLFKYLNNTNIDDVKEYIAWKFIYKWRTLLKFQTFNVQSTNNDPGLLCFGLAESFFPELIDYLYFETSDRVTWESKRLHIERLSREINKEIINTLRNRYRVFRDLQGFFKRKLGSIKPPIITPLRNRFNIPYLVKLFDTEILDSSDEFDSLLEFLIASTVVRRRKEGDKIKRKNDKDYILEDHYDMPVSTKAEIRYDNNLRRVVISYAALREPYYVESGNAIALLYGGFVWTYTNEILQSLGLFESQRIVDRLTASIRYCIQQYSNFSRYGVNLHGENVWKEALLDHEALKISRSVYKKAISDRKISLKVLPGLNMTSDKMFFLGFAQNFCSYIPEKVFNIWAKSSSTPPMQRVVGTLQNSHYFYSEFKCPKNSGMRPTQFQTDQTGRMLSCVIY